MKIQPIDNSVSMQGKNPWKKATDKVIQKVIDSVPERTVGESARILERWEKIDHFVSRPAENRLILGATGIVTQPIIAECNFAVDKETRTVDRNRKIAKNIVCPAVGILLVRGPVYTVVKSMTDIKGESKYSQLLLPKSKLTEIHNKPKFLKNYRSALSMGISLALMLYTNFAFDAPGTAKLTNYLNENEVFDNPWKFIAEKMGWSKRKDTEAKAKEVENA